MVIFRGAPLLRDFETLKFPYLTVIKMSDYFIDNDRSMLELLAMAISDDGQQISSATAQEEVTIQVGNVAPMPMMAGFEPSNAISNFEIPQTFTTGQSDYLSPTQNPLLQLAELPAHHSTIPQTYTPAEPSRNVLIVENLPWKRIQMDILDLFEGHQM
jgi:hypothetical protein